MAVIIDGEALDRALRPRAVVDAVARALAAGLPSTAREVVELGQPGAHAHVVAGRDRGRIAVKANVWRDGGVAGVLVLLDDAGDVLAAMDAGPLTSARTAAATVVAIERLRPGARPTVAVIGAGRQAAVQCRYLLQLVDVAALRLWSIDADLTERTASGTGDARVAAAASMREALTSADVVVTVTPSSDPYLGLSDVEPDALVVAHGADTPAKSELGLDLLEAANLVGIDLAVVRRHGELRRVAHRPATELGVADPSPGLTVVASAGSGWLDLAAANLVHP